MRNETNDGAGTTRTGDEPGVYRAYHDADGPATMSDTVIAAVADVTGIDPTETVIPLADSIDPDALDGLFEGAEGNAQVIFRVSGVEVLVRSDGHIRLLDESVVEAD